MAATPMQILTLPQLRMMRRLLEVARPSSPLVRAYAKGVAQARAHSLYFPSNYGYLKAFRVYQYQMRQARGRSNKQ